MKITLQKMRWFASGALIFCFVGMIGCRLGEAHWNWLARPLAFFEAATVGALADWFAVVALFRHPLGIPIPHTAILPNNKARVAESLATFLEEGFLTEAQLGPRIRQIDFAGMISRWLSANAESLSRRVGKFAPVLVERIPSEQITSLLTQRARYVILTANAAPLLASGLQTLTGSGRDRGESRDHPNKDQRGSPDLVRLAECHSFSQKRSRPCVGSLPKPNRRCRRQSHD
jgi:uncharacterized membrane-anchored protein YjiN (DUF445 family)